jgi:hypothetical protein
MPGIDAAGNSSDPPLLPQITFSAPRLYLAMGVTTIRTTGSVEPYAYLNLSKRSLLASASHAAGVSCP